MKIEKLKITNFRTLEDTEFRFPSWYVALCGPNDSGKTNVVRAVRALMKEESPFTPFPFADEEEITFKEDYPKWKDASSDDRHIRFELCVSLDRERDTGLFQFLAKQLALSETPDSVVVELDITYQGERAEPTVTVTCQGNEYTELDAQEVLKRIQTSKSILFHNSTQADPAYAYRSRVGGVIRAESPEQEAIVASMRDSVAKGLKKIAKTHQGEIESLLGRLERQYKVSLSMPAFDFSSVPFSITLGHSKFEVPLEDWGSGTKNRTMILMTLFRAKQLSESDASASKTVPVIIIEEPESFLHPAAQAEFGRVLQDLAEEFRVQVIVTTHSPYLLNTARPESNILLQRHTHYKQQRETQCVDTSGENWMEPFSLALGLESEQFRPWKKLLLGAADSILLVEGETDVAYFELLRDERHGSHRLTFDGDIVSYDGTGALSNTVLLRFVQNRHKRVFVTYDLDAEKTVAKSLRSLGLERRKHFLPVGVDEAGKRCIEGLLPDSVVQVVYGQNPTVVQAATSGTKEEQQSARNRLKQLMLDEFQARAEFTSEFYGSFYEVVAHINKALG